MTDLKILKSLPVAQLFSLMANNEKDSSLPIRAYKELLDRYEIEFEKICRAICKKNNFDKINNLDKDVLRISLEEIYLMSSSYELPKKKISKRLEEKLLLGWFGKIAEKVLDELLLENHHFEKKHRLVPDFQDHLLDLRHYQEYKDELDDEEKLKDAIEDEKLKKLRIFKRAMERLKPKEREVLIEYKKIKEGYTNMSEDRIAYLCKRLGTNHANLLQIKHRATKKLNRLFLDEQKKEDNRTTSPHSTGAGI